VCESVLLVLSLSLILSSDSSCLILTLIFSIGAGVYTFFRDHEVNVTSTIVAGADAFSQLPPGVVIVNAVNVHLNGLGRTAHVVNQLGAGTDAQKQISYKC
jgi:hypothetical protein